MNDLFGDPPPKPIGKPPKLRRDSKPIAPTPAAKAQPVSLPSPAAPPAPPPAARANESVQNLEVACDWPRGKIGHVCAVGGGSGMMTRDDGRTWYCGIHVPPAFFPANR